jgi:hypothetical protein
MPDEKVEERGTAPAARPPTAAPHRTEAIAEMVSAAAALKSINDQLALEAMQLPEKRLDDASPDGGASPYTLRDDGDGHFTKVDAFGNEVK